MKRLRIHRPGDVKKMTPEPWYRVELPREEVREGRSFKLDECAEEHRDLMPHNATRS